MDYDYKLDGKTLIFTDLHIGLKNSNTAYLNICAKAVREMLIAIKEQNISNVIFCGDLFHSRRQIDINAMNYALKLIDAISKKAHIYLICGNHDIYYKNSLDVNSINMFRNNNNVTVVSELKTANINGSSALFVPWLSDISGFKKENFDMMFGHFEISSKFLIASYIEHHSKSQQTSNEIVDKILSDNLIVPDSESSTSSISDEIDEIIMKKTKSSELIGEFVEIVKKRGIIYSGHIHGHDEFIAKDRQFVFVGSPYQQNFGEMDSKDGFYVLDESNKRTFHQTTTVPRRIKISISEILKTGIDKFDFSIVHGNIIKKIFDIETSKNDEYLINQKINANQPFEEDLAEYDFQYTKGRVETEATNETLALIKKSKLEYLKTYVENIDENTIKETQLEKSKIYDMLEFYYNQVTTEETK